MKQSLLSGKTLVVDRYAFSGVAYSVAKVRNRAQNFNEYMLSMIQTCFYLRMRMVWIWNGAKRWMLAF
jgi:thymidylate kinase